MIRMMYRDKNMRYIKRHLFNIFNRKKNAEAPLPSTFINNNDNKENKNEYDSYKKFKKTKEEETFIKKRDELMMEFSKKRDKYDEEIEQKKRDIDEAVTQAKREYDITIGNIDYNKIILDNINIQVSSEFNTIEDINRYVSHISTHNVHMIDIE